MPHIANQRQSKLTILLKNTVHLELSLLNFSEYFQKKETFLQ